MKKKFEQPYLMKCELQLEENIALSWEYYDTTGAITAHYHFVEKVAGVSAVDSSCFDLFISRWTTSETGDYGNWFYTNIEALTRIGLTNINSANTMETWMNALDEAHSTETLCKY